MKKYTWIIIVLVAVISVLALWGWNKEPVDLSGSEDTTASDATTDTTGAADTTSVIGETTIVPDTTDSRPESEHTTMAPDTTKTNETTISPDVTDAEETTEAPEITEAPETTAEPETTEAEEATEAPETTEAEETTEAPETTLAPETTAEPETTPAPETTEAVDPETTAPIIEINEDTAIFIAKDYLGEKDPDTGYTYSYQYVETTAEGSFKIRVSWYLEEDDRYATCGYLIVTPEGEVTKFDW